LAKLHAFLGEERLAHDEYTRALDTLPNLSYTWANLGALDLRRGNENIANREFERALFLDGGNRLAANMLASDDFVNGKTRAAEELYAKAILAPEISVHAQRTWRLYHVISPTFNDLFPQGLLPYISPGIQPVMICDQKWLGELRETVNVTLDVSRRIAAQEDVCSGAPPHLGK
jgi:tetratricopeptide (TPR) repeat protein